MNGNGYKLVQNQISVIRCHHKKRKKKKHMHILHKNWRTLLKKSKKYTHTKNALSYYVSAPYQFVIMYLYFSTVLRRYTWYPYVHYGKQICYTPFTGRNKQGRSFSRCYFGVIHASTYIVHNIINFLSLFLTLVIVNYSSYTTYTKIQNTYLKKLCERKGEGRKVLN